ncbi:ImpA family metalloprotease [Vibrio amylolyticus]|uniref:ImpA family metalloprotease n=1 Tax=Vibrio amylolyticus TaxID=2847292 RepID=UPI00354ADFB4
MKNTHNKYNLFHSISEFKITPKKEIFIPFTIILIISSILSGCDRNSISSNSVEPESFNTYEIKAIDGYLNGALIFLDVNGNLHQDSTEPFAITEEGGIAKLDVTNVPNYKDFRIYALALKGKTIDESTGTFVHDNYVLTSIPGNSVVTPLSTLLSIRIEKLISDTGVQNLPQDTISQLREEIAQDLGLPSESLSDNYDYVELKANKALYAAESLVFSGMLPNNSEDFLPLFDSSSNEIQVYNDNYKKISQMIESRISSIDEDKLLGLEPIFELPLIDENEQVNCNEGYQLTSGLCVVDSDLDGIPDTTDQDDDNDGVLDAEDAFPLDANESIDTDGDSIGNNADPDDDNDGVLDTDDAFPLDAHESIDTDGDSIGNNADPDDDNDGVLDVNDAFPLDANESIDTDGNLIGNNADPDDDNDGVLDAKDAFPLDTHESIDTDEDSIGNNADPDDDNDGVLDADDAFPLDANESIDTDGDSIGNNTDPDDDNDGVLDADDAFPLDANESIDTDEDSIGNNADPDDDNDGVLDADDAFPLDESKSVSDIDTTEPSRVDTDHDGLSDSEEIALGRNPNLYEPNLSNEVNEALSTGDISNNTTSEDFINAALAYKRASVESNDLIVRELFGTNAETGELSLRNVSWYPHHDSAFFKPSFEKENTALLSSNSVYEGSKEIEPLALAIGGHLEKTPYIVFGANPFGHRHVRNEEMDIFLKNSFYWLANRQDFSEKRLNLVIAQQSSSSYFKNQSLTREWLDSQFGNSVEYNLASECDDLRLKDCISSDTDILILSTYTSSTDEAVLTDIVEATQQAINLGIGVMLSNHDGALTDLAEELVPLFNVSYLADNYWKKFEISDFDPTELIGIAPLEIEEIESLLVKLKENDFTIDFSHCSENKCSEESQMASEFTDTAETIKDWISNRSKNINDLLFASSGEEFWKSLILLADTYRKNIVFPMTTGETPTIDFLKSYYADYVQYDLRSTNMAQPDVGNFSDINDDLNSIVPGEKELQLTSKISFMSTGAYALPGQTFTVTRNDNSEVTTEIFINALRSTSTYEFEVYNRPKFLSSDRYKIDPGQTISLTHTYGGPIYVSVDVNEMPIDFTFSNIGKHPTWRIGDEPNAFIESVNSTVYDWVDFTSQYMEIHSTLDKMRETLNLVEFNNNPDFISQTMDEYTYGRVYALAGYQGPGVIEYPEIQDFASENGWTLVQWDELHHGNMDQPSCGSGCSGNPYDANWAFDPLGHGNLHEIGHTLEKKIFRMNEWDSHASTNYYSYFAISEWNKHSGSNLIECQDMSFSEPYAILVDARNSADPVAYMETNYGEDGWRAGVYFYIQMMALAEKQELLTNGWVLKGRMHVIEREYQAALDSNWDSQKALLGFSSYTADEAEALSDADWIAIVTSKALGVSTKEFLSTWGYPISVKASEQLSSDYSQNLDTHYVAIPDGNSYCEQLYDELSHPTITIGDEWPH